MSDGGWCWLIRLSCRGRSCLRGSRGSADWLVFFGMSRVGMRTQMNWDMGQGRILKKTGGILKCTYWMNELRKFLIEGLSFQAQKRHRLFLFKFSSSSSEQHKGYFRPEVTKDEEHRFTKCWRWSSCIPSNGCLPSLLWGNRLRMTAFRFGNNWWKKTNFWPSL